MTSACSLSPTISCSLPVTTKTPLQDVFQREDFFPFPDDPWQHHPFQELPPDFLDRLYQRNMKHFSEAVFLSRIQMIHDLGTSREDLRQIGDYVYSEHFRIGSGDHGTVYLGQHVPSNGYVAIKIQRFFGKDVEKSNEYLALKNLGRLYGCFLDVELGNIYFCMPLFIGDESLEYTRRERAEELMQVSQTAEGKIEYHHWQHNFELMLSYFKELQYTLCRGVMTDLNYSNIIVSSSKQQVVIVDLEQAVQRWREPNEICLKHNLLLFHYFLGLGHVCDWFPLRLNEGIELPLPVQKFHSAISAAINNPWDVPSTYTLAALKQDLEELEKSFH